MLISNLFRICCIFVVTPGSSASTTSASTTATTTSSVTTTTTANNANVTTATNNVNVTTATTTPNNGNVTTVRVNTGPPVIWNLPASVTVQENSPPTTSVFTLNATDPDGDAVSFRLVATPSDGNFALKPAAGEVVIVNSNPNIDYETHIVYYLSITASDGQLESAPKLLTVNINNTNEPPTLTNLPGDILVAEGTKGDQLLFQVTAKDAENDVITYTFTVLPAEGASYFTMDANGRVRLTPSAVLNHENRTLYTASIKACDVMSCSVASDLIIRVGNVNEGPAFSPASLSVTINENQVIGYILPLTFTVSDPEGDHITYGKLTTAYSTHFIVNSGTGVVRYAQVFDFDDPNMPNQITIYVTATDTKGRQALLPVTVNIVNLNDNGPVFHQSVYTPSVAENSVAGVNVVVVSAKDNDLGAFGTLTYSMDTTGIGATYFATSTTGVVTVKAPADRETYKTINFTVSAADSGGKTASALVQVSLIDQNDNSPVFTAEFYNLEVRYNATTRTAVGSVTATDADATGNTVRYLVTSGDTTLFDVHADTGQITVSETLAQYTQYSLLVRATDSGVPKLTALVDATVRIDTFVPDDVITYWEIDKFRSTFTQAQIDDFRQRLATLCNQCVPRIEEVKASTSVGRTTFTVYFLRDQTTESKSNTNLVKTYIPATSVIDAYTIDTHGNPATLVTSATFAAYPIVRIHRNSTVTETSSSDVDWLSTPAGTATLTILLLLLVIGIAVLAAFLVYKYCPPDLGFLRNPFGRYKNNVRPSLLNRGHVRADRLHDWNSSWDAKYGRKPHTKVNNIDRNIKPLNTDRSTDVWRADRAGKPAKAPSQRPPGGEYRSSSAASARNVDIKMPREIRTAPDAGTGKASKLTRIPPPKSIR